MRVPYDFRELDFICRPDHNRGAFSTSKSQTAGMVSNANVVMSSPYEVDLYDALDVTDENGEKLSGLEVPHCVEVCEKEWNRDQVLKFSSLVNKGYGYRLYLDDLPSATIIEGKPHYDTHIPLGYIRWRAPP